MSLRLSAMCIDAGKAYCTTWEDSFLYAIDMTTGQMDDGMQILDDVYFDAAFLGILSYDKWLVLIPGKASEIVFLDLTNKSVERYAIPKNSGCIGTTGTQFFSGIVYGHTLYLFGYCFPGIVALDLLTRECHVIDEWLGEVSGQFTNPNDGCFHVRFCRLGDKVYYPFMNLNAVMIFDLQSERVEIRRVGDEHQRYISIEYDGENFWLVPRDTRTGCIVQWNLETGETRQFDEFPSGFSRDIPCAFYQTVNLGNRMLLLAHVANMNVSIDFKTGKMAEGQAFYDATKVSAAKYPFVEWCGSEVVFPTQEEFIFWNPITRAKRGIPYVKSKVFLQHDEVVQQVLVQRAEAYRTAVTAERRRKRLEEMCAPANRGVPFGEGPYSLLRDWIRHVVIGKAL